MDFICEILFELLFEVSFELGTNKKVAMPIRILAIMVILFFSGAFLAAFLMLTIAAMKKNIVFGWIVILFDIIILGCAIHGIWKKLKTSDWK